MYGFVCRYVDPHCSTIALTHLAIFVGPARQWIPELVERAKNLKISGGFEEGTDM